LQVDVVGRPSPGEHRVQLLPRLVAGDQAMHGVGGNPLGGVNRVWYIPVLRKSRTYLAGSRMVRPLRPCLYP
jgi:hypothetical protein